jgi:hypothetical protein
VSLPEVIDDFVEFEIARHSRPRRVDQIVSLPESVLDAHSILIIGGDFGQMQPLLSSGKRH